MVGYGHDFVDLANEKLSVVNVVRQTAIQVTISDIAARCASGYDLHAVLHRRRSGGVAQARPRRSCCWGMRASLGSNGVAHGLRLPFPYCFGEMCGDDRPLRRRRRPLAVAGPHERDVVMRRQAKALDPVRVSNRVGLDAHRSRRWGRVWGYLGAGGCSLRTFSRPPPPEFIIKGAPFGGVILASPVHLLGV